MANVFFKRGLRGDLATTPIQDGNIYITTDERGMYVDVGDSQRIRIGDFCEYQTFAEISAITDPDEHAFYYADSENILVKPQYYEEQENGTTVTKLRWVQINGSLITDIIQQNNFYTTNNTSGTQLVNELQQGRNSVEGQVDYVSATPDLLKVQGTTNVVNGHKRATLTFTPDATKQSGELSLDTYGSNGVSVVLTNKTIGTNANGQSVNVTDSTSTMNIIGDGSVSVSKTLDGDLKISGAAGIDSVATNFNANGKLNVLLYDTSGSGIAITQGAQAKPIIQYGAATTKSEAYFNSGVALLDVYTINEVDTLIDSRLRAFNAMEFKGGVDIANPLPTTNIKNGDTYKVVESGTYAGISTQVGDMFIATGQENSDTGYIDTANLTWTYIPSGGDGSGTTYTFAYNAQKSTINFLENGLYPTHTFQVTNGLNVSEPTSGNFVIEHASVSRTDDTDTDLTQQQMGSLEFNIIKDIQTNAQGHVIKVTTQKVTVVDTHNQISTFNVTKSVNNNIVTTNVNLRDGDGTHQATSTLTSNSLELNVNGTETSINLVWGTF